MCVDVASGMAFLETALIVHRDLAARNVLLTATMQCKVGSLLPPAQAPSVQVPLGKRARFAAHLIAHNNARNIRHNIALNI